MTKDGLIEITLRETVTQRSTARRAAVEWRSLIGPTQIGDMTWTHCLQVFEQVNNPTQRRIANLCIDRAQGPSTDQLIREAFHEIPIPPSEIIIQPPDGITLVNLETLFRTEAEPFEETITLLGTTVVLRIRPIGFTWTTGDGHTFTTTNPGLPYEKGRPMTDYVSHTYPDAHDQVNPTVTVEWAADYSTNNQPWLPVTDTVTITGPPTPLQVKEAIPVLTSEG